VLSRPSGCASVVQRVNLTARSVTTVLRGPRSEKLDAIPSPDGGKLAVAGGPYGAGGLDLTVRDLGSGQKWTLGADRSRCAPWVGAHAAWSPDGRQLIFPYGPSSCNMGAVARLVIAPADRTSTRRSWTMIHADRGCGFLYGVFDPQGVAAVEGCDYGQPADMHGAPQLGYAFLLQLSRGGDRVLQRFPLNLGFDGGGMAANPKTGTVLISESQAAGNGVRPYNWVWAYSHRALRLIHRYNEHDFAKVIATPW
jgi:hypothetical protein